MSVKEDNQMECTVKPISVLLLFAVVGAIVFAFPVSPKSTVPALDADAWTSLPLGRKLDVLY